MLYEKYDFRIQTFYRLRMTFYNDFVPKNNRQITHYAEKRRDSITLSTLAIKGGGGGLLQAELKGLMDRTAYLILKMCGPWKDPCQYRSDFCSHAESLSLASTSKRKRQTGEVEEEEESRSICGFHCCHGNRV